MRILHIAPLICSAFIAAPALADGHHSCGALPALPAMFDVDKATVEEVKLVAAEYKAYQDENTNYIDCLKETAKSDAIQGLAKKERKKMMDKLDQDLDQTVKNEQLFADAFNDNVGKWREKQLAATQ